ncbi:MAG: 23S rRNA (guanosine(2251)-2'-O)-methyltransferase RlmB [Thermodesulfobacteriota bacterium]|nr:23S rRNA (guanosine(2251)-2'-O)-methyltransferase RlmB [Thermodesulfobacteriota bacterium]
MMPDLIWGIHPVQEKLKNNPELVQKILVKYGGQGKARQAIIYLARSLSVSVQFEKEEVLEHIVGHSHHQGIVAYIQEVSYKTLEDILSYVATTTYGLILVLDGIVDPQNLGSLIRSGHAAGVQGIVIPKDRSAQVTGTVEKVAAGALTYVPVARVTNIVRALERLKEAGYWVIGTAAEADKTIYETDLKTNVALVIGSEAKGMRPLVRRHCDLMVSVPMLGKVSSLNAAVAGAVVLFEILRQRTTDV